MPTQKRSVEYEPNFLAGFLCKAETLVAAMFGKESVETAALKKENVTAAKLAKEEITSTQIKPRGIKPVSLATIWKEPVFDATIAALPNAEAEAAEVIKSNKEEALKIDTTSPAAGKRILIKNQVETKENGIYEVIKAGKAGEFWEIKRTTDANTTAELFGAAVYILNGTTNKASYWQQKNEVTTVGTTAQAWEPLVTTESIGALAVTAAKIAKETITGEKLVNATVTGKQTTVTAPEELKELKELTSIEPSATEVTTVYVSILAKLEKVAYEIVVDGVSAFKFREELLVAASANQHYTFRLKAGAKFEVKTTVGKIETSTTTKSVYTFQKG